MPLPTVTPKISVICPKCQTSRQFLVNNKSNPLLHHHYECEGCESILKLERVGMFLEARLVPSGEKPCANGDCNGE